MVGSRRRAGKDGTGRASGVGYWGRPPGTLSGDRRLAEGAPGGQLCGLVGTDPGLCRHGLEIGAQLRRRAPQRQIRPPDANGGVGRPEAAALGPLHVDPAVPSLGLPVPITSGMVESGEGVDCATGVRSR